MFSSPAGGGSESSSHCKDWKLGGTDLCWDTLPSMEPHQKNWESSHTYDAKGTGALWQPNNCDWESLYAS